MGFRFLGFRIILVLRGDAEARCYILIRPWNA